MPRIGHSNDLEWQEIFCPTVISQGDDRWNFVSLNPFPLSHILKWKKESSTLSNLFRSPYQVRFFCFSLLFKSKKDNSKGVVFRHVIYKSKLVTWFIRTCHKKAIPLLYLYFFLDSRLAHKNNYSSSHLLKFNTPAMPRGLWNSYVGRFAFCKLKVS